MSEAEHAPATCADCAALLDDLRSALQLLERHRSEYSTRPEQLELMRLREVAKR